MPLRATEFKSAAYACSATPACNQGYRPGHPSRWPELSTGTLASRNGLSGKFVANSPRTFAVWGSGGVPCNAKAVTGIVSVYS